MSLVLARSEHPKCATECPLSGVKRTSKFKSVTSAFDPKRTSTLWARRCELVREPRSLSERTARRPRFDPSLARLTRKHIGHVRPSVAAIEDKIIGSDCRMRLIVDRQPDAA
jgi:hypothetical protein